MIFFANVCPHEIITTINVENKYSGICPQKDLSRQSSCKAYYPREQLIFSAMHIQFTFSRIL